MIVAAFLSVPGWAGGADDVVNINLADAGG